MTVLENYKKKKSDIIIKLSELAVKKIGSGKTLEVCEMVGKNLNISGQSVYNYISGRVNDGYLAEAIYQEFKKIKTPK